MVADLISNESTAPENLRCETGEEMFVFEPKRIVQLDRLLYSDDPADFHRDIDDEDYPAAVYELIPLACTLFGIFLYVMPWIILPAIRVNLQGIKTVTNISGIIAFYLTVALLYVQLLKLRIPATTRVVTQAYYRILHRRLAYAAILASMTVAAVVITIFNTTIPGEFMTLVGSIFSVAAVMEFLGGDREKYYDASTFARIQRLRAHQPLRVRMACIVLAFDLMLSAAVSYFFYDSTDDSVSTVTATAVATARVTPGPSPRSVTATAIAVATATVAAQPPKEDSKQSTEENSTESSSALVGVFWIAVLVVVWLAWVRPQTFQVGNRRRRWARPTEDKRADEAYWSYLQPSLPVYYVTEEPGSSWSNFHRMTSAYVVRVDVDGRRMKIFNSSVLARAWRRASVDTHDQYFPVQRVAWVWNGKSSQQEYLLVPQVPIDDK